MNQTTIGTMDRQSRENFVGKIARPLLQSGFDSLPNRIQWRLMSYLRVNLPDEREDDFWESGIRNRDAILEYIEDFHPSFEIDGSRVLEIGCGPGRILVPMAELGADAYGIDIAPPNLQRAIQNAENRGLSITVERSDSSIPFSGKFDFIYSNAVFMHIPRRTSFSYIDSAADSLTDGGIACFEFRDLTKPLGRSSFRRDLNKTYQARVRYHTPEEVRCYLEMAGFDEVEIYQNPDGDHASIYAVARVTER